jgi:hypothetical protein
MPINISPTPPTPVPPATTQQVIVQIFSATATDAVNTPSRYSANDILERTVIYSGITIVSQVWKNLSTGATMAGAPLGADIVAKPSTALTDSELRASPVPVIVEPQLPPNGSVTDNVSYVETLSALVNDPATPSQYAAGDVITYTSVYDNSVNPPQLVSGVYTNQTTGQVISPAPAADNLSALVSSGITDAELRAKPVEVTMVSPTPPVVIPPATTLDVVNEYYRAIIDDAVNTPLQYRKGEVLRREVIIDMAATPASIVSTTWYNDVKGPAPIATVPGNAIVASATTGLTNTELRAQELLTAPYWESYGIVTDSNGNMVREYEQNYDYSIQIYRDWVATANNDGTYSQIAGIWRNAADDTPF